MDVAIVSGLLTLVSVFLGGLVGHVLGRQAETRRLTAEDERRWLNERRAIYAGYLGLCEELLRELDGVGVFLPYRAGEELSDDDAELLSEGLFEWFVRWDDDLQPALSEVQLMATPKVSDLADRASAGMLEAAAPIETRAPFVDYYPVWFQARDLVHVLRNEMRAELGLPGIDQRPVRDPDWPWLPDRPDRDSYRQVHPRKESERRHPSSNS